MNMSTDMISHQDEVDDYPQFVISEAHAQRINAALPIMIADRLGYVDRQMLEEEPSANSDIQSYIDMIVESSSKEPDYLMPDTPMKEALFRVILANGNRPMTAAEISERLTEEWAMSAFPRNLSPYVINRLLEHSGNYCIVQVPDEPEDADGEADEA